MIENGRIISIGDHDSLTIPDNSKIIDATGQYVIPGLWDMHVHVGSRMAPFFSFPLFIAHGITNVRDLGGHATYEDKQLWNKQILSNELLGPRFQGKAGQFVSYLSSNEQTRSVVAEFPGSAPDFIKVYNAVLPDFYFLLLEEAGQRNIPVLGHKPRAVKAIEAVKSGHKSFEHARLFLFECYPGADELRETYRAQYAGEVEEEGRVVTTAVMREMLETHSDSMFNELANAMVEHDTWFCPTHITRKMDAFSDDPDYRNDLRLKYVDQIIKLKWKSDADGMINEDPTPVGRKTFMDFYHKGLELTGKAHQMGVKILAGTDATDTYSFPGSGIHDELQELVKAGLTPVEALRSATILAAEYFDLAHEYGSVEQGKVADILLLDANPLTDISNTRKINTVVYNGNIYTRKDLDVQLNFVENIASSWSALAHMIWSQRK